jgi:exosortase C (VPDSG-CTERM-specific)
MIAYFAFGRSNPTLAFHDALAWKIYGFLLLLAGTCAWFLGRDLLRSIAFPLAFLVFMAPFPVAAHDAMERFLQHWSADASYAMISAAGTPILRDGLIFHLPGIVLEVAPQCSGIRSSVALFITSLVAGHFFLRSPWKKAVLTFAVIPLAILRNGLRIFTIAQLCVYVSPDMVNSFIHHRGGPIFFAISLVPFLVLLYALYRSDRKKAATDAAQSQAA